MVVALIWTAELLDEYVADNIVSSKLTAKRERALVERRIVHGRYVRDHLTSLRVSWSALKASIQLTYLVPDVPASTTPTMPVPSRPRLPDPLFALTTRDSRFRRQQRRRETKETFDSLRTRRGS